MLHAKMDLRPERLRSSVGGTVLTAGLLVFVGFACSPADALAQAGYVLDGLGGVHAYGGAPVLAPATPYFGFDAAVAIRVTDDGDGYYVLDSFGGLHSGGSATPPKPSPPYFGFRVAKDFDLLSPGPSLDDLLGEDGTHLVLVRGTVGFDGVIRWGGDFAATRTATGRYFISYDAGTFSSHPTVLVQPLGTDLGPNGPVAYVESETFVGFVVETKVGGVLSDRTFKFIAAGPQ